MEEAQGATHLLGGNRLLGAAAKDQPGKRHPRRLQAAQGGQGVADGAKVGARHQQHRPAQLHQPVQEGGAVGEGGHDPANPLRQHEALSLPFQGLAVAGEHAQGKDSPGPGGGLVGRDRVGEPLQAQALVGGPVRGIQAAGLDQHPAIRAPQPSLAIPLAAAAHRLGGGDGPAPAAELPGKGGGYVGLADLGAGGGDDQAAAHGAPSPLLARRARASACSRDRPRPGRGIRPGTFRR